MASIRRNYGFDVLPGRIGAMRGWTPSTEISAEFGRSGVICCTNATPDENRFLPTEKIVQLLDSRNTLADRPPAPTRRTPRRMAKRRIDKAARRKYGRPFRVPLRHKLGVLRTALVDSHGDRSNAGQNHPITAPSPRKFGKRHPGRGGRFGGVSPSFPDPGGPGHTGCPLQASTVLSDAEVSRV